MKLLKDSEGDQNKNQMSLINDTDEVVKFLELAGRKSFLNEHTVTCRMTACKNLFSILHEGEDSLDYILGNLEILINRFKNKNANVQPSTLKVYKSRVKGSLEDYREWSKDPIAWQRSLSEKPAAKNHKEKSNGAGRARKVLEGTKIGSPGNGEAKGQKSLKTEIKGGSRRVSFPIRTDFNFEVTLPNDGLTLRELLRLGLFLFPYCKDGGDKERGVKDELSNWGLLTN